ncbi:hypothetical protein H9Q09_19225 [Aurantimonas sp. DM33-3]|uniref:hypothetical protein n=1 Tax=Aurantimonas sp. DM33-3 TaxID=2766955 RepID=UPI001651C40B|nr:hypothetical protein [Aurantimonas sp. DM33-3]MBC6718319.1 hypothetical protein [Aurantimonas sp. DM33-3]
MMLARKTVAVAISVMACAAASGTALAQTAPAGQPDQNGQAVQGAPATAPSGTAASTNDAATRAAGVRRVIGLGELGFDEGLQFSGLNGERELFFPVVAEAAQDMVLRLSLRSQSAFASRRSMQVLVGDQIVFARGLGNEDESFTVEKAIDPASVENGFVKVTLRYSGAITEDRCVDQRVAGDFLSVLPGSALEVALDPAALDTIDRVLAMMPDDVVIRMPERDLREAEMAALIRINAALVARNARVTFDRAADPAATDGSGDALWSTGTIALSFEPPADAGPALAGAGGLSVLSLGNAPGLLVSGDRPQAAAELLSSRWQALALGSSLSVAAANDGEDTASATSFADLGIPLTSASLVDQVVFDAAFLGSQLPAGTRPSRLDLDLAVATDTRGSNVTIAAFLNNYLLASTTSPGGNPVTLSASIPAGLAGRENALRVLAQRQPDTGDCANPPQGFPVQLLPTSSIETTALGRPAAEFFEATSAFGSGVTVFMPEAAAGSLKGAAAASLVAGLISAETPFDLRYGPVGEAPQAPFILVADMLPEGIDSPVRFDEGRVRLTDAGGDPLLDIGGLDDYTIVQIVRAGDVTGLWIRPNADAASGDAVAPIVPVALDRGDVALVDEAGLAFAFSTTRDQLVQVTYPDRLSLTDLARQYWPWIIGALWIIGTLIFVTLLSRIYRRRRAG